MKWVPGSSPLARGLPAPIRTWRYSSRIIPARAGFTSWDDPRMLPGSDHPRSRGVYWVGMPDTVDLRGSSPLARGLLAVLFGNRHAVRIIPARAGFTAR